MANILVVDDEESIRITLSSFLQHEGHSVRAEEDFDSAARALGQEAPDLIYVDILLGGESGIELLKIVKKADMNCPVIIITGEPSYETAAEAVRLGAFDYVAKPIVKDTLLRMTRVALKHKKLADDKIRLEREKERLRLNLEAIFRSVPDAVITVDRKMRLLQSNDAAEKLLNVSGVSCIGEDCGTVFLPPYQMLCEVVRETLRTKKPVREYRVEVPKVSPPATMMVNCSPLLDHQQSFRGAVLVVRDISRLAGMERELKDQRQHYKMVGKSPSMQDVYQLIRSLSDYDTTVLITGASGTGKELVAEALHYSGERSENKLVKVNCSALSENLLESELFGHVRGAFTGAFKEKVGRFKLADKGTIFLDEIGDISPNIQVKLLRVLQEKEFERVGDTDTIKVDVRVIAATNLNLREKVANGEFREDLFYRLKVVEIKMPSLFERRQDIPLLTEHFVDMFNNQFGKNIKGVTSEVQAALMSYTWPGNVREFRHALEHAFILCRATHIDLEHLPSEMKERGDAVASPENLFSKVDVDSVTKALQQTHGNKARAARVLGVSRQTIYRKIKEFGIE